MPVSIDGLRLYGAQETDAEVEANAGLTSAPTMGSDEAIISALESQESPAISGRATANRISNDPDYPSDPHNALAYWVQRFESLCQSEQGDGWQLVDDERGRSVLATVQKAQWTYSYEAPFEVQWTLGTIRGNGVLSQASRTPNSQTPASDSTLGGTSLGSLDEMQVTLEFDVEPFPIAFGDPSDAVLSPNSGVVREVSWSGFKHGSQTQLQSFDDEMRGNLGGNTTLTLQTAFPGTSHEIVLSNYRSTMMAGDPARLRYTATGFEGLAL